MNRYEVYVAARWLRERIGLLLRDDRGQDLIEYALLTAGVGLAGAATWPLIVTSIGSSYRLLDQNTQGLWTCEPGLCGP